MSLLDRIDSKGIRLPALRNEIVQKQRTQTSVVMWPQRRDDLPYKWRNGDFEAYATEGFQLNSLIYSAIMYKARAQMAAPLRAYIEDPDRPTPALADHPLRRLVERPNTQQSWAEFQALNVVYLNISGNSYTLIERDNKEHPVGMRPLRPDRVWCIPGRDGSPVMGFLYVPEGVAAKDGVPILPQDMIHVKFPNPLDPFEGWGPGLSPLASAAYSGDVDNAVTRFLKTFFERGTMVAGILKFDTPMDPDDIQHVKQRWREQYGGSQNWSEVGVLDQGGEYERVQMTIDEMGFEHIDRRNEARLVMPLGVPSILLGTPYGQERSITANIEATKRQFWEDTMVPELQMFEDEYAYYLQWEDAFVRFDYSKVPALQRDIPALTVAWTEMVDRGVPKNVAAEVLGIALPTLPDGDVIYMNPMSQMRVGSMDDGVEHTNEGAVEAVEDGEKEVKVVRVLPEGYAEPLLPEPTEVEITEDDIDRAIKTWDQLMPDYAGLLDAEITDG